MKYLIFFICLCPLIANAELQVCYTASSCHKLVSKTQLTTPGSYTYLGGKGVQYKKPTHFVDLQDPGTSLQISKSFKRTEFMSMKKGRYGILAPHFVQRVQKMRDSLGKTITINSGYRSPKYNKGVGGAKWSRHMYGDAMDFKVSGKSPSSLKKYCQAQGASFIQLYKTHIHCDWRNKSLPKEFFGGINESMTHEEALEHGMEDHLEFYDNISLRNLGDLRAGSYSEFVVDIAESEDNPKDILIEWEVYKNDKLILKVAADTLRYPLSKGQFHIKAIVGGYWSLNKSFTVD